ncbi:glycine cleavage system aminomethyltransferase GcvT [Rhodococcus sp. 114MFTsu3.1]|uniref:glycine cleavage system aminomethyltransferase GcvT n=1 Tax=Rhodococcus sp. 114MFTsu3.1 TaxID=1172184 RepID=UPI000364D1BF|nr:glycine cleavage system aminomethyltransferase GcvT [Rhodococcus sp. 114MFTsu3.1]
MTTATPASSLLDEHKTLGASFTDFAGWQMPLKYSSELTEHRAVRTTAGLFDLSHMGEIEVIGSDAGAVLDYALAGELSKIAVGRAKYSLLCNHDGGVVDDLVVYRLAENHFLVVANAANTAAVYTELCARSDSFDVVVNDKSAETALVAVQGPKAQNIVAELSPAEQSGVIASLKYYAVTTAEIAGQQVLVARTGYTGEDGFELYIPNAGAVPLWRALTAGTIARGGSLAGLACRDTLRLEAGMALYGHELTVSTSPYEAGLGKVVSLNKNFVGRDALQLLSEQQPRRRLVGLAGTGRRAARAGYPVVDAHGATIGRVTSGALSPTLGYPIALAYIDVDHSEVGTPVAVGIRHKSEQFRISPVPFYRRS